MKRSVFAVLGLGLTLGALGAACTREGPAMGAVTQLNEKDGGAASFSWAYYTSVVADGPRVAVSWMNQNGNQNRNVMVRHSTDRGEAWSPELALNSTEYENTISVVPTLHFLPEENGLLALWQARRNEAGQKFVLVRRSKDFGATWDAPTALNQRMQSFLPVLAQRDDAIIVAWTDERNVQRDIYVNRSLDSGKTWLDEDVRVSKLPKSEAGAPALAIGAGENAHLVWEERPRGQGESGEPHLSVAWSEDLGATWSAPDRVDMGEKDLPSPMWPQLVYSEGRLTLVWTGGVTGETSQSWLWTSSSDDGGRSWSKPTEIYAGKTQPFFHLKTKGPHVYLVWHGGEGKKPGHIYWNASDDGGKTWRHPWTDPVRLDRDEDGEALHPRLALARSGDEVAVTWQESNEQVVVSVSRDRGQSWPISGAVVATEEEGDELRNPQVAVTADAAYVLWERWPDKRKHIKTFADVEKVLPKDAFVRRVDLGD